MFVTARQPPVPPQSFGAQLRVMRIEAGLSLRKTAKLAGLSPTFLTDVEYNRRLPSRVHLAKLAIAIGRPIADLQRYDPREAIEGLLAFWNAYPEITPWLTRIFQRIENRTLTVADLERLANN